MSILVMLFLTFGILIIFACFVIGFTIVFLKSRDYLRKLFYHKLSNQDLLHCFDCKFEFVKDESIKTRVGIYPCPNCAGKNTGITKTIKNK